MNYYKSVINGYIEFIGEGDGDTSITKDEYDNIMSIIRNRPMDDGLFYYRLKEDLSWEKFQVEPEDTSPISNEEAQYTQELEKALGIIGVEVN